MGFLETLSKFRTGLAKTRDSIVSRVQRAVSAKTTIDDELLTQVEEILISGDVGVETTGTILSNIKRRVKEEKYNTSGELIFLLKDEVAKLLRVNGLTETENEVPLSSRRPYVIMVVGVNGAGKTTTIGKLAYLYRQAGRQVVIGAADTFRAAANEQLEIWAQRAGAELMQQAHGADPAAVVYDSLNSAIARDLDVVIIDTAGRLHTKINLMVELKKIRRVMEKRLPGAPHEVLLVLDSSTGQNALQQAREFTAAVDVTGLVLTKLDGTAKGGIVLAINHELNIPVKYIGVGEQIDDLQPFDKRAFLEALFEQTDTQGSRVNDP